MTSTQHEAAWPMRVGRRINWGALVARLGPRALLVGLLALTAVLYLWGLSRLGYANDFYSAAVKSGTQSWKAFLFGSFDSANYITVDKPPASLWLMELSGRLFGFSSFSMLLPQALEGVAAVALVYASVKRWFSTPAALLSGLVLAITPVAALMFRYNNPDALLVLLLVVAAYAVTRALEQAPTLWLAVAGAAIGFGFLTKMMQAFLVLPAFALVYLIAAPAPLRRRIWQILIAGLAMIVAGGWWVAIVELWPASARPYIGGSTNNSILDLIWGYNGLGRIDGASGPGGGGGGTFSGAAGILRLFNSEMGGQISWLLPAALLVLVVGLLRTLRAPRTDRTRAALLLWGGWLVVSGLVYSFMSGIIHPYYTNTLAPAIAVLVGVGAVELWHGRRAFVARVVMAAAVAVTAWWSYRLLERSPNWHPDLRVAILAGGLAAAAAAALLVVASMSRPVAATVATVALLACLGGSLAYTVDSVGNAGTGALVSAGPATQGDGSPGAGGGFAAPTGSSSTRGPSGFGPPPSGAQSGASRGFGGGAGDGSGGGNVSAALTNLLARSSSSYTWVAATSSSMTAAPIELATGKPVMAIGGFTGSDQTITLDKFKAFVATAKIHYYIGGGGGGFGGGFAGGGGAGGQSSTSAIASWVSSNFKAETVGGTTVYDLTA